MRIDPKSITLQFSTQTQLNLTYTIGTVHLNVPTFVYNHYVKNDIYNAPK